MKTTYMRPIRVPEEIEMCAAEPASVTAGERASWRLNFVLAKDISPHESLRLLIHGGRNVKPTWNGWQTNDESADAYVALLTESGERLTPNGISETGGMISFGAPSGGLKAGDRITAEFRNAAVPTLSYPEKFFVLLSAPSDAEVAPPYMLLEAADQIVGACTLAIIGGEPAAIRVHAPSHTSPGEEISLLVRPEDEHRNLASGEPGDLVVRLEGREISARRVPVEGTTCCRLEGITLPGEGIYRFEVEDRSLGVTAVSNPVKCIAGGKLLWGSMHNHSEQSDGTGPLDRVITSMRDECAIDFGATSDHDHATETPESVWAVTQAKAAQYNDPGRFTLFLGYEWAKWRRRGDGDRNVYYLHDYRPIFRSDDEACPTPPDLFRALKDETALVIPHHPAHPGNHNDWKDHDPSKERLVEIYSLWGNSECSEEDGNIWPGNPVDRPDGKVGVNELGFVQRALELGWRIGFIAASDDHTGHGSDRTVRGRGQTGGLVAVYAGENTRESIFGAMYDRRCYATTGERIIVDFSVSDHPMGTELSLSEHPELASLRRIKVTVSATAPIDRIEVLRNNRVVYSVSPGALDAEIGWEDTDPLADVNLPPAGYSDVPFTFYYVRITQADKQQAWASPVWIS